MNEKAAFELATQAVEALKIRGLTLSLAESCTGGLLSKLITDVPGVSAVYKGGVCTYSNGSKVKLLKVEEATLREYGAVSSHTARQMARGVCELFGTDVGVSVTGIAGPNADGTDKPVGLIYIGTCFMGQTTVLKIKNEYKESVRENNRYEAARIALKQLLSVVSA